MTRPKRDSPLSRAAPFVHDADVRAVLDALGPGLRSCLGGKLVGVYLYGSLVAGDYHPGVSDIDLVVVLREALDVSGFDCLHRLHQSVVRARPEWRDRLELAYISRRGLRRFRQETSRIGIISPGEPFHIIEAGSDWLISWYALREDGVALAGPPVAALVDAIPTADYLRAVAEHILHYRASVKKPQNKPALSYIVLTVARGLYTLGHGEATSKIKAAAWAKARFPQWSLLIERALRWRVDPGADPVPAEALRPVVAEYVEELLACVPDESTPSVSPASRREARARDEFV